MAVRVIREQFGPILRVDSRYKWDTDVFVRDLQQGTTTLASLNHSGANSGNGISQGSGSVRTADSSCFLSEASDLVATDTNGVQDAFVRDLQNRDEPPW
jgi:hypothetical protein